MISITSILIAVVIATVIVNIFTNTFTNTFRADGPHAEGLWRLRWSPKVLVKVFVKVFVKIFVKVFVKLCGPQIDEYIYVIYQIIKITKFAKNEVWELYK